MKDKLCKYNENNYCIVTEIFSTYSFLLGYDSMWYVTPMAMIGSSILTHKIETKMQEIHIVIQSILIEYTFMRIGIHLFS